MAHSRTLRGSASTAMSQRDVFDPFASPSSRPTWEVAIGLSDAELYSFSEIQTSESPELSPELEEVSQEVWRLTKLPNGWDGYGSPSISWETSELAVGVLETVTSGQASQPIVVPGTGGSVNLAWHQPGLELELEIKRDQSVSVYFFDEQGHVEWEKGFSDVWPQIRDLVKRFH